MTLHVRDLSVAYGDTIVLRDLNLEIETGERFAIMGPSGSGKSSLLRAIAGITTAQGTITLNGRDITSLQPHERSIGLMFQDFALFPHMSVGENVAFGLRMRGIERAKRARAALGALESVGLAGLEERNPASLSGGEQQRVALARTLVTEPDLLMLDEPLGSLDLGLRDSLLEQMRSIVDRESLTTIYVTHDRIEAFAFADRLAVILDGAIVRVGTPIEVWQSPGTVAIARLIGHPNVAVENPWFDMPVSVPEAAISLGVETVGSGMWSQRGVVKDSLFADGRFLTFVAVEGVTTSLQVHTPTQLVAGTTVDISVDRGAVIKLER